MENHRQPYYKIWVEVECIPNDGPGDDPGNAVPIGEPVDLRIFPTQHQAEEFLKALVLASADNIPYLRKERIYPFHNEIGG